MNSKDNRMLLSLLFLLWLMTLAVEQVAAEKVSPIQLNGSHYEFELLLNHTDPIYSAKIPGYFKVYDDMFDQDSGKIFLYLSSGETPDKFFVPQHLIDVAQEMNSMLIVFQIRFFANEEEHSSFFEADNLKYLQTSQIIEDAYQLIRALQSIEFNGMKAGIPVVYVFGQKYLGSICLYMTQSYPTVFKGCVAQDPSLQSIGDFTEIDSKLFQSAFNSNSLCPSMIQSFTNSFMMWVQTERLELLREFKHFFASYSDDDIFIWISDRLMKVADYGNLGELCDDMIVETELSGKMHLLVNKRYIENEMLYSNWIRFNSMVQLIQEVPLKYNWMRLKLWQQCSEFGLFHTSKKSSNIASPDQTYELFQNRCIRVFGESASQNLFKYEEFNSRFNLDLELMRNSIVVFNSHSPLSAALRETSRKATQLESIDCHSCTSPLFIWSQNQADAEIENVWKSIKKYLNSAD